MPTLESLADELAGRLVDLTLLGHPALILEAAVESLIDALGASGGFGAVEGATGLEVRSGRITAGELAGLRRFTRSTAAASGDASRLLGPAGQSWIAAPIMQGGAAAGCLAIRIPGSAVELSPLIALAATSVSAALGSTRGLTALRDGIERLNFLYQLSADIGTRLNVHALIDEIIDRTKLALRVAGCAILLLDEERNELYFEIGEVVDDPLEEALREIRLPADAGIAGWIVQHGQPLIVDDVTTDPRFYGKVDESSGFQTRSILGVPLAARGRIVGVMEVLNRCDQECFDQGDVSLLTAIAGQAAIALDNARLYQSLTRGYSETIRALVAAIETKDKYTAGHSGRVARNAEITGRELRLDPVEFEALHYAAVLHDVGKIGIEDTILTKPAKLTAAEYALMKKHPELGFKIVGNIKFLSRARLGIRHHHEAFDGSGYPDGIAGQAIPLISRIIGVSDAYDAMTLKRAYRPALGHDVAVEELRRCAGGQFDPEVVEAFLAASARERAAKRARRARLGRPGQAPP